MVLIVLRAPESVSHINLEMERAMKTLTSSLILAVLATSLVATENAATTATETNTIVFRELRYDGRVTEEQATFTVEASLVAP